MKEDHGLVRGITTTLVDGATMFFFWRVGLPRLFFFVRVVAMTFLGVWDYDNSCLVCGVATT